MQQFVATHGMRLGPGDPKLPLRLPVLCELVGSPSVSVDYRVDGTSTGLRFQAVQLRGLMPHGRFSAESTAVLVPRPTPGPELRLAPAEPPWTVMVPQEVAVGDPAFDASFHVSTSSAELAQHLFGPASPIGTWLLDDPRLSGVVLVLERTTLLAFARVPLAPGNMMAFVELLTALHERTRQHLLPGDF